MSNIRLAMGAVIIAIALFAQFYKKKFPENRDFLLLCIALYPFRPNCVCVCSIDEEKTRLNSTKNLSLFLFLIGLHGINIHSKYTG